MNHIKSAFTGKAEFYQALFFLDDLLHRVKPLAPKASTSLSNLAWHSAPTMSDQMGFPLGRLQYRRLCSKLEELSLYSYVPEVAQLLQLFTTRQLTSETKADMKEKRDPLGWIDDRRRAVAVGHRKTARAKVMLVGGSGLMCVNGKPVAEYFQRACDMFRIAEPLRVTGRLGRYNVWALTRGGGSTGKQGETRDFVRTMWGSCARTGQGNVCL